MKLRIDIGRNRWAASKEFKLPGCSFEAVARKKRKKKEEEEQFEVPEFDEVEFMRKEVLWAKAAVITVIYAFMIGLVSYLLTILGVAYVAAIVGLGALYGLRYLFPAARLDTAKFDRKTWAGNGATFLFAWLAFWVLLLNPPFLDISPPVVQAARVPGAVPENIDFSNRQTVLPLGSNTSFEVLVLVTDNIRVARVEATVDGGEAMELTLTSEPHWYRLTVSPAQKDDLYVVEIRAADGQNRWSEWLQIRIITS